MGESPVAMRGRGLDDEPRPTTQGEQGTSAESATSAANTPDHGYTPSPTDTLDPEGAADSMTQELVYNGLRWERVKDESGVAFEAFTVYVGMGASRSLLRVAQELSKSLALMKRWSGNWAWGERTAAYDDHLARQAFDAEEAAASEVVRRHGQAARTLTNISFNAIRHMFREITPEDGDPYWETDLSDRELVRVMELALLYERKSAGIPDKVEGTMQHGGAIGIGIPFDPESFLEDPEAISLYRAFLQRVAQPRG